MGEGCVNGKGLAIGRRLAAGRGMRWRMMLWTLLGLKWMQMKEVKRETGRRSRRDRGKEERQRCMRGRKASGWVRGKAECKTVYIGGKSTTYVKVKKSTSFR